MTALYSDFAGPHRKSRRKSNVLSGGSLRAENHGLLAHKQRVRELKTRRKQIRALIEMATVIEHRIQVSAYIGRIPKPADVDALAVVKEELEKTVHLYPELTTDAIRRILKDGNG